MGGPMYSSEALRLVVGLVDSGAAVKLKAFPLGMADATNIDRARQRTIIMLDGGLNVFDDLLAVDFNDPTNGQ